MWGVQVRVAVMELEKLSRVANEHPSIIEVPPSIAIHAARAC